MYVPYFSGLNLTGEYLGQTKTKVEERLNSARGGVLFIDEAYELGKGMYGTEAMTTLVNYHYTQNTVFHSAYSNHFNTGQVWY